MKKDNFNNLFVRGGKTALAGLVATSVLACNKGNTPYGNTSDGVWGLIALAFIIGMLAAPAVADKIKQNRRDKQR